MASKCSICDTETKYKCIKCELAVCNKGCSVFAPETTDGWKAGARVGYCVRCSKTSAPCLVEKKKTENDQKSEDIQDSFRQASSSSERHPASSKARGNRSCLNLSKRVELIRCHRGNPKLGVKKLAEKFGCGKTQVAGIIKDEENIMKEWESNEGRAGMKRVNQQKFYEVNQYLWKWYSTCRQSNIPISGPMLQEEALIIAKRLGGDSGEFNASNGWLDRWKKRYNICEMNVAGEEGDVSQATLDSWSERARELMAGYKPENVWNMDETGQFWKALPDKSLSERGKRCRGGKQAKQRLTWAFFVSASGEKENPIVIGKSLNPRCFKNLRDRSFPHSCHYYANEKAWMNSELMGVILSNLNRRMKRENRHILLFLDNAPCHPHSHADMFSNVKLAFLPKNSTSRSQPLDAGIIKAWKVKTKRKLLRYICSQVDSNNKASEIVKSVHLLQAIQWGKQAWDEVDQETVQKCFKKVGLSPDEVDMEEGIDDPFEGEDMMSLEELCAKLGTTETATAQEFVDADDEVPSCPETIDISQPSWRAELRRNFLEEDEADGSEPSAKEGKVDEAGNEEFDCSVKEPSVKSSTEARKMVLQLSEFADFGGHEKLSNALLTVQDILFDMEFNAPKKQSVIGDYFHPHV